MTNYISKKIHILHVKKLCVQEAPYRAVGSRGWGGDGAQRGGPPGVWGEGDRREGASPGAVGEGGVGAESLEPILVHTFVASHLGPSIEKRNAQMKAFRKTFNPDRLAGNGFGHTPRGSSVSAPHGPR